MAVKRSELPRGSVAWNDGLGPPYRARSEAYRTLAYIAGDPVAELLCLEADQRGDKAEDAIAYYLAVAALGGREALLELVRKIEDGALETIATLDTITKGPRKEP